MFFYKWLNKSMCMDTSIFFQQTIVSSKTYYSQEKKRSSTLSSSSFVGHERERNWWENRKNSAENKYRKREANSRPVNWIGIGSAVINIQTNTGFVYLYEYIYHSLGLINLFIFWYFDISKWVLKMSRK